MFFILHSASRTLSFEPLKEPHFLLATSTFLLNQGYSKTLSLIQPGPVIIRQLPEEVPYDGFLNKTLLVALGTYIVSVSTDNRVTVALAAQVDQLLRSYVVASTRSNSL